MYKQEIKNTIHARNYKAKKGRILKKRKNGRTHVEDEAEKPVKEREHQ
jgi:hypothetical protein